MNVLDAKFTGPLAPYVSTISFYRGDVAIARRVLADRVGAVLEANPWLGGSIGTDAKGRYALKYARGAPPAAARHFVEAAIPELGPALGPEAVKPLLAPLALPRGVRHDGPLFRVALVTGGDADHFAVVVDASHALGDGATYYKILNMLGDGGAPVSALDPVRPAAFDDAALAAALGKGYAWWWSVPRLFAVLCGALSPFGDIHRATYLVNGDWIERQKRDHAPPGGFVSTNDVVTSFLAKGSGCAHLMMAVDLRGRAAGANRTHAGNARLCVEPPRYSPCFPACGAPTKRPLRFAAHKPASCDRDQRQCESAWRRYDAAQRASTARSLSFELLPRPGAASNRFVLRYVVTC